MAEKRIIEQESSNEVYSDDWFAKDSPTQDTSKILGSDLKAYMNEGMMSADTIADEYNSSTSYDVGDLCFYNGTLYVCTTATTGAWDGNDWSETTIEELIAESGKVQDVKVNGTSVVDVNKVAQIVSYKEVTQAEYNALPSSKNSDNVLYCIKDAVAPPYVENVQVNGASLVTNKVAILDSLTVDGTASGAIATFSDGSAFPMKSLKVAIEPQQDLHGYDAPWVGGAGKNKFDSDTVLSAFTKNNNKYVGKPSYVADNYVISGGFKTNTRYTLSYKAYNNTSASSNFRFIFSYTDETEEIIGGFVDTTTEKVIVGTSAENKTISKIKRNYGNGVEFTLYDIQLEEGSTATTYAPYSNICPISGWSAVDVSVSGVNVWDEEWEVGGLNPLNGETTSENDRIRSKNFRPCKPNITMFYYIPSGKGNLQIVYYDINKNYLGYYNFTTEHTFTTPNGCYFFKFNTGGSYGTTYNNDISINYPSTDTSYHAYNGHTYTIDLDGTRYGGELDVVSGVLTVDKGYADLGSLNWSRGNTGITGRYRFITQSLRSAVIATPSNVIADLKASIFIAVKGDTGWASDVDNVIWCDNYKDISVVDESYTDATEFKTAMDGVQLVYKLATPLTIQLTPTQVNSLLGVNNVWADCGDIINATYIRDLNITINNLINA